MKYIVIIEDGSEICKLMPYSKFIEPETATTDDVIILTKSNHCVVCGAEIPEGDMICNTCYESIKALKGCTDGACNIDWGEE